MKLLRRLTLRRENKKEKCCHTCGCYLSLNFDKKITYCPVCDDINSLKEIKNEKN
ncbi:hypothetical protein LCGC14_0795050 [marine sediment metagenome]|uniref:Uncharacterized protein n=1 Tax=marine sediment metagenome TaxID=412755 RepID=A0A0F9SYP7_9ZZZZ